MKAMSKGIKTKLNKHQPLLRGELKQLCEHHCKAHATAVGKYSRGYSTSLIVLVSTMNSWYSLIALMTV
jgi:hypothetical protein